MKTITWNKAVQMYLTESRLAGQSKGTLRVRRYQLTWLASLTEYPHLLTVDHLIDFANKQEWSAETRRSFFNSVRTFYKWTNKRGLLKCDPTSDLMPVKVPQRLGRPPSDMIILRAIENAPARTRLMIRIAATLGLRICEIAVIHERDWDGHELIVHGKGGKDRVLTIADPLVRYALNHMHGYLFEGRLDGHLSPGTVGKLISKALPDGVSAHKLRHRFATIAYRNSDDLYSVAEALGHAKISTTQRYVGPSRKRLRSAIEGALLPAA